MIKYFQNDCCKCEDIGIMYFNFFLQICFNAYFGILELEYDIHDACFVLTCNDNLSNVENSIGVNVS